MTDKAGVPQKDRVNITKAIFYEDDDGSGANNSPIFDEKVSRVLKVAKKLPPFCYGFDGNALQLMFSYMSNRRQRTKINSTYSTYADVSHGIPQ